MLEAVEELAHPNHVGFVFNDRDAIGLEPVDFSRGESVGKGSQNRIGARCGALLRQINQCDARLRHSLETGGRKLSGVAAHVK